MSGNVKVELIIQEMDLQFDETKAFFNKENHEIVTISDEEFRAAEDEEAIENYPDWQQENIRTAEEILYGDAWIALPSKFDIDEYNIMERFCLSLKDQELSDTMYSSIKGSGAFQRFKKNIQKYGIEKDWYDYREKTLEKIAIEWCESNGLSYE